VYKVTSITKHAVPLMQTESTGSCNKEGFDEIREKARYVADVSNRTRINLFLLP